VSAYDGHTAEEYAAELASMGASEEETQAAVAELESRR
jgi:hypothetical protein